MASQWQMLGPQCVCNRVGANNELHTDHRAQQKWALGMSGHSQRERTAQLWKSIRPGRLAAFTDGAQGRESLEGPPVPGEVPQ